MSKIALLKTKSFQIMFIVVLAVGIGIAFALDTDNDGMSDLYENFFKLNPTNSTDAAENNDTDLLDNLAESGLWTNPDVADTDCDGFPDHADNNPLSRAVVFWGHPDFTTGADYAYTGPDWWLGASKQGGIWTSNSWQLAAGQTGGLSMTVDPGMLTNNLVLDVVFADTSNSVVRLQLLDENSVVVSNLIEDITDGTGEQVFKRFAIPLTACTNASRIDLVVDQTVGAFDVHASFLYIDEDGDGLDADQERQLGTRDTNPDSDGDGVGDAAEYVAGTDPSHDDTFGADSDGDGLPDALELSGKVYQAIARRSLTWNEAKADAQRLGGHLVTIEDANEQDLIAWYVGHKTLSSHNLWIGARILQGEDGWGWATGEAFGYTHWITADLASWAGDRPLPKKQLAAVFQKGLTHSGVGQYWYDVWMFNKYGYIIEYDAALDPFDADTDGDGIDDLEEIRRGSNPSKIDTDGDGTDDAAEYAAGTDPSHDETLEIDSDGDGLPDVLELSGKVYQAITRHSFTWDRARADAERLGGHLVTIADADEQSLILQYIGHQALSDHNLWIGARILQGEDGWGWVTGEEFGYAHWITASLDPSVGDRPLPKKRMAAVFQNSFTQNRLGQYWYDVWMFNTYGYVIEYDAALNPFDPDTDGDGIDDLDEIRRGSNPAKTDTDGDGIDDAAEYAAGTDPSYDDRLETDTDGDGLPDALELSGKVYQSISGRSFTWEEAKADAERLGGHLVAIADADEQDLVAWYIGHQTLSDHNLWIGARILQEEDDWGWVTGEPFGYTHWITGKLDPLVGDRPLPKKRMGAVFQNSFTRNRLGQYWYDVWMFNAYGYIIEYDAVMDPLNADTDGDGIPDFDEIRQGSNPAKADTDGDGVDDAAEYAAGTDPSLVDTDFDGLDDGGEASLGTDPLNPDTDGDELLDGEEQFITLTNPLGATNAVADAALQFSTTGAAAYDREIYHFSVDYAEDGTDLIIKNVFFDPAVTWSVTNAVPGMYRLSLQFELKEPDSFEQFRQRMDVEINGTKIGEMSAVIDRGHLAEGIVYTPWLGAGIYEVRCRFRRISPGVRIHALELHAIHGTDSDSDGIDDWVEARLGSGMDTDLDGLSDADEIAYGSNQLSVDTDGDGLSDGDEMEYGTDLLDTDSDNDGVSDGAEVHESRTNPLVAEFDGTVVNVVVLSGSQFTTNSTGDVQMQGAAARVNPMRGSLEYALDVPQSDLYRLSLSAAHEWLREKAPDESRLEIYLDGLYIGTKVLDTASEAFEDVLLFLPWMPQGQHVVEIVWDNYDRQCALLVQEVRLQELGGPDADGNGTKDWVEVYLDAVTSIDAPVSQASSLPCIESYVSPACIEGDALYVAFARIVNKEQGTSNVEVKQGVGDRWFANLPLDENGITEVGVSFQNGGKVRTVQTEWVAYNLIGHDGEELVVRKGDSVKFVVLPDDPNGGQFDLEYDVELGGDLIRSPNTDAIIHTFTHAGTFAIGGEYRHGNDTDTASVQVTVVGGGFPEESPACMPNRTRIWTFGGMDSNVVYETDGTVGLEVLETSLSTNNQQQTTVSLCATQTLGEHWLIARLFEGGPILDHIRLDTFWGGAVLDGYAHGVAHYDDMSVWEFTLTAKQLPPGVTFVIETIVAGVVFADDFGTSRILTAADFNEQGELTYQLAIPAGVDTAACHIIKMYQDGVLIGTAYSAGEFVPGT